jgi:hypothetical protein
MTRTLFLAAVLMCALPSAAQVPDTGPGNCAEQSSDKNNWHPCDSSSGSESHCTLFHPCHGDQKFPATEPAHSGETNGNIPPKVDPRTYEPQYTDAYKWEVFHEDNKAGNPLPWEKDDAGTIYVEAQAILDRLEPVHKGIEDIELYRDWADHLVQGISINEGWEDLDVTDKAIEEINKRAIELVKQTLIAQLDRIRAFESDSPELKQQKEMVARQRMAIVQTLNNEQAPRWIAVDKTWRIDSPRVVRSLSAARGKTTNHYWQGEAYEANNALKSLIRVSETGDWENLRCPQEGMTYCVLP